MPTHTYKCKECDFSDDFMITDSVKGGGVPTFCPNCDTEDSMEKQFSMSKKTGIDVPGGYEYTYGKKAWKENMDHGTQSEVISGKRDPY